MIESIKSGEMKADREAGKLTALLKQKFPNAVLDFHSHTQVEWALDTKEMVQLVAQLMQTQETMG